MAAAVLAPTLFAGSGATQSPAAEEPVAAIPAAVMATDAPPRAVGAAVGATATLASGTPLLLMLDDELSTTTSKVGDRFGVTVLFDVYDLDRVVIPKGTTGYGEVTFATKKGGFGKPGILGITLRQLDLDGKPVALSGRYREEGANKNGATAATWFAVSVFSGFIQGKPGVIPKGRELNARTGEAVSYTVPPLSVAGIDIATFAALAAPGAISSPIFE